MTIVLFSSLILFLILGVPIAVAMGLSSALAVWWGGDISLIMLAQKEFSSIDSFPLMAIPFFILAGTIMENGGLSKRLINFATSLIGHIQGGLGLVVVLASLFFASISGSGAATVAAVGAILIPAMIERGYHRNFAGAITAVSGELGVIIPPSINLILFGVATGTSISALFIAGIIPGLLIALSLLIALPIGISTAIYLNEIARKNKVTHFMEISIELLAGVPSIIFGLMGVVALYPVTAFFKIEGLSILLGALTMSVILLPIIIRATQESLKVVPDSLRMASLSLGATQTQTIFKVVLPSATSGILTATLLAISRVIGESAALIYTMGTFVNDSPTYKTGGTSLAVHIWSIMSSDQPNFELASAISIIILLIVLILNLIVKAISYRYQKMIGA